MTRVLIVDDEPMVLDSTRRLLDLLGFETAASGDPHSIIERIRAERPTVVLQDVRMPGLDVEKLLRAIRADPEIAHTAVLLFSADMELASLRDRLDADGYLEKPFRPEDAVAAIERVRGLPR